MMMISLSARTVLYSAWFCPYAQRVWAALNELGVSFELIEALKIDPKTDAYVKHEGLLEHNPKGLVPTLVVTDAHDEKKIYCESIDILRGLYESAAGREESTKLYEEAQRWNKDICSKFYKVMIRQDRDEVERAWKSICAGLADFSEHLQYDGKISYYDGNTDAPGLVDFAVFPFVHRLYIVEHYKQLSLPDGEAKNKIMAWQALMEARPSVKRTLAEHGDLIPIYHRYADGTAKSQVADSVRQGREAHDI
jgi:glutathione S-transferase